MVLPCLHKQSIYVYFVEEHFLVQPNFQFKQTRRTQDAYCIKNVSNQLLLYNMDIFLKYT